MIPAQLTLRIDDLSCARCVKAVQSALESIPGVFSAEVTLEPRQATVNYDASTVPEHVLVAAVEAQGYTPVVD